MDQNKRLLSVQMAMLIVFLGYKIAFGQVILHDPTWEAPGGYFQAPSGISPSHIGGTTWVYSNFNSGAYDALHYVIGDYDYDPGPPEVWTFNPAGPAIGTSINGMTRLYYDTFSSDLGAGIIVWTNSIYIYNASTSSQQVYDARFTLSVYDASSNPVPLISATSLTGMDIRVGGSHQIQGDFSANWQFEISNIGAASWTAASSFYDSLNTLSTDSLQTSVTRAFYFTPIPGDFDADGDVDGTDVSDLIANLGLLDLEFFADNFGKDS